MRSLSLLTIVLLLCAPPLEAKRLKVRHNAATADTITLSRDRLPVIDSVALTEKLRFSGYDKVREAMRESVFLTNTGSRTINAVTFDLNYTTLDGRQLHHRRVQLKCLIPANETRRLDFPAWDKQQSFYYHLSRAPKRVKATPFDVTITPVSVTLNR